MIIWLASYPKSGNTWIRIFLNTLLFSEGKGDVDINSNSIDQFPLRKNFKDLTDNINDINEFAKNCISAQEIINLQNETKIVLSLGGGAILSSPTRKLLKTHFITVFLDTDFEILQQRLKKSYKRPLLINENILQKLKKLDNVRRKYYLLADIKINNYESPANTVAVFLKEFNQLNEKNN